MTKCPQCNAELPAVALEPVARHTVITLAAETIDALAGEMQAAHTVLGKWPAYERETHEEYDRLCQLANDLRDAAVPAVPPREPTEKMIDAGMRAIHGDIDVRPEVVAVLRAALAEYDAALVVDRQQQETQTR